MYGCVLEQTAMTGSAEALRASIMSPPSSSADFQRLADAPIYGRMVDHFGQSNAVKSPAFNRGGSYAFVDSLGFKSDSVTPHHIPQHGLGFFTHAAGGAVGVFEADHKETRTFGGNGRATKELDADKSFRQLLFLDIWDLRSVVKSQNDGRRYNQGLMEMLKDYREKFGHALDVEKK